MEKIVLSFIALLFLWSSKLWAELDSVTDDPWMTYQVEATHSLWRFSEHLGVKIKDIPIFIREVLVANPSLKDPNLIHPGDEIFIRASILNMFIPEERQYRVYWNKEQGRKPASVQQIQYKAKGSSLISLRPRLAFSRIDAKQRGTGAKARLLSSVNLGLKGSYSWKNLWGPGEISLDFSWAEYNEDLGRTIGRNQIFLNQLEYIQGIKLSHSWMSLVHLGLYQSPYLFTDRGDNLLLKVGTQPGLGASIQKVFYSVEFTLNLHGQYLMRGYAGDTLAEEGYSYGFSGFKKWKLWGVGFETSLYADQKKLLSEVTSQTFTEIGLGLGLSF